MHKSLPASIFQIAVPGDDSVDVLNECCCCKVVAERGEFAFADVVDCDEDVLLVNDTLN